MDNELHFMGKKSLSRQLSEAVKFIMAELGLELRSLWFPIPPALHSSSRSQHVSADVWDPRNQSLLDRQVHNREGSKLSGPRGSSSGTERKAGLVVIPKPSWLQLGSFL